MMGLAERFVEQGQVAGIVANLREGDLMRAEAPLGGKSVDRYTLTNARGMTVKILTYGGIIQEVDVPDRHGQVARSSLAARFL